MKKIPLGIQSFRKIIEGGYVYADKTQYVYSLLNDASYYFLSRPRRFGKSLLLDTVAEVFSGERELFEGLWIYGSDYDFKKHPVIRIDLSNIANGTPEILQESILSRLGILYAAEGFTLDNRITADAFFKLILLLHQKYNERVVVLVDEYDKPILDHINDLELAEANRMALKSFFGVLKSSDAHLRLTLFTGVSKFTKTSIFSELNNLLDITLAERYANICGITTADLDRYFDEHLKNLATRARFKQFGSVRDCILAWYDGYSWDGETRVLNPFSLLSFFSREQFLSFWYASGTPKFLMDLLKKKPESFLALENLEISERVLDSFDVGSIEIEPLLFQTGYLTVKEVRYDLGTPYYRLEMPNWEVREAFNLQLIAEFTEKGNTFTEGAYLGLREAFKTGEVQKVRKILSGLFASIPYDLHVPLETYYHSIFYAVMLLLGFKIDAEVSVAGGRIDAILELNDLVYVFEFKYQQCPPDASPADRRKLADEALAEGLKQIKDRGYADKYQGSGKTIHLAAFAFLGRDNIEVRAESSEG